MNIIKKVGLSVLVVFGIAGVIAGVSGSPSTEEQTDIDFFDAHFDTLDADGRNKLHYAVFEGNIEAVRILIKRRANLNIQDGRCRATALYNAVMANHMGIVKLLIDAKADVNIENCFGHTPLHAAVHINNKDMVKLLIAANADVNKGNAPLHKAIKAGYIEMAKLLIDAKADVNIQNGTIKNTPLHEAAQSHNIDMVKLLITANADVNIQNEYGAGPLLHLLYISYRDFGHFDFSCDFELKGIQIIKLLIDAKADVNMQVAGCVHELHVGKTALHFAVQTKNIEAVKLLVAAKADKNIKDIFYDKTALDYAQTQEVKELLRRK